MIINTIEYSQRTSIVISWLRFPLILLIIMLHCYSVQKLEGNHEMYSNVMYPFALWLGETGVPGFFFISGFLFFFSKKTYLEKLRSRIHTLLVPYFLWNFILLSLYIFAYAIGYPQSINGRNIADFSINDYLRLFWDRGSYDKGNFVPLLCPLWYIRNLIIMSVISPLLYYIIKYTRELYLLIIAVWWLTTYHNAFIPQTLFFFSLGAYLSILCINPLEMADKKKALIISLFFFFSICDIISHVLIETPISLQIHRLSLISNIPVLLLLSDWAIRHGLSNKILTNSAFIVFCVHYPIVAILRKICMAKFGDASDITQIILYFVCVGISTLLSIFIYWGLNRYFPKTKNILSGNR